MRRLFFFLMACGVASLYLVPEDGQPAAPAVRAHSVAPGPNLPAARSAATGDDYSAMAPGRAPAAREQTNEIHLVDFGAEWCAPCKQVDPIIDRLARQYGSRVIFSKVDVDKQAKIAAEFGIRGVPTVLIFRDGFEAARLEGLDQAINTEAALQSMF